MNDLRHISSILNKIELIENESKKKEFLLKIKNFPDPVILAFINAHAVNLMFEQSAFRDSLTHAHFLLRDGKGMEILFQSASRNPGLNMNGTDFIPEILDAYRGKSISVYGTEDPWLSITVNKLKNEGQNIVDYHHGFDEHQNYIDRINIYKPDIILFGMGMPNQELLATKVLKKVDSNKPLLIICGGALIDFYAKRVKRAPKFLRKLGLEWLYRLYKEPKRLFKRYVIGNFIFIFRISKLRNEILKIK